MNISMCIPVKGIFLLNNKYFAVVETQLSLCRRNAFQSANQASDLFLRVENAAVFSQGMIYNIPKQLVIVALLNLQRRGNECQEPL